MDEDVNDGVALVSAAHPRPPWWQRPYWWIRSWFADISEDSIETIEIEVPPEDVQ